MLTRSGVAKRLGKSLATVRRLEGHALHPEVDENGVHLFDEDEVEELAREGADTSWQSSRFRLQAARPEHDFTTAWRAGMEARLAAEERARQEVARLKSELTDAQRRIAELIADQVTVHRLYAADGSRESGGFA